MVQRKVAAKLSSQADNHLHHHKAEIQHHDVKSNIGADLKKKMKKSGSIKRPKHPGGKSPPSPPEKTANTPNYMKPTTSSDARKEQLQSQLQSPVSIRNSYSSPCSSILRRKGSENSKPSLLAGKKATKTLFARTLTKNPSFKPARAKCSTVVLCEDLDVQRATCSSTLKDCKFPAYLSLNPGGTESEGTSAVKVCPYTYCSLNGHHHTPLPPLKSFLRSRRRGMKTQRSFKVGCLSPRRVKPGGDDALIEEESRDFFVEIYSKDEDDVDGAVIDGNGRDSSIIDDEAAAEEEDEEERDVEMLSDAPICEDFDIYESTDRNIDVVSNQESKSGEEIPPVEEEKSLDSSELSEESKEDVHFDEFEDSEGSDMDWEKGYHSALNLDYDYEYSPATEDMGPDPEADTGENCTIKNEFMIESDGKDWCLDEFWGDEVSQVSYAESLNSDAFSSSDDGESSDSDNHLQSSSSMESPAPFEAKEEESEPAFDEENHVAPETSSDNQNHQSLPDEDSISVTEEQVTNLENAEEDIINSSLVDSGKEPHSKGTKLQSSEAEMEDSNLARFFIAKSKKPIQESDELGPYNLRGPNFLPLEPAPEAEKVDLKHQDLDEKKNAEEWMVDYALRQVVTKLGPARKRKVALLVEAFEKVMPASRPVQACN